MAEQRTITCDCCKSDITSSESVPRFRVVLSAEPLRLTGWGVAAVLVTPWPDRTYHFCGRSCLVEWLTRQVE